jgi:hypothetical protein
MLPEEEPVERVDRRRVIRGRLSAAVLLFLFFLVPVLFLYVGPIALKSYDAGNQIEIVCTVSSAEASTDSSYSTRGVGASTLQVVIKTKDCGSLALRWGLTRDNIQRTAQRIYDGGQFRFTVGKGSWEMRELLRSVRQAVFVRDVTPVRSDGAATSE